MNNIVANFSQILDFAQKQGMPINKKRGIIREYIQSRFIATLYSTAQAGKLSFVGGTSLRLLRDLPRFSEDLDFDNHGLKSSQVEGLIEAVVKQFRQTNIELKISLKGEKTYVEIKFPRLLFDLKISTNPKEKLKIKIDWSHNWKLETETVLMNKYGFVEQVVTNKIDQILVQKLTAYAERKQVQPRDMFDIVWMFSRWPNLFKPEYVEKSGSKKLFQNALIRFEKVGLNEAMKRRLKPFLFEENEVRKLELFEQVLRQATLKE
jgi:predicted nucleotidyltransferase component of viral defense system